MLDPLPALTLGFVLGMGHATDADHVAAVMTIVGRERTITRAAAIGALWGMGHTVTVVLLGSAIILFRIMIPPRLGLAMELAVAVMLIWLGVMTLRRQEAERPASLIRPMGVGFVHGLAGSAFVAMLVLQSIASPATGVLYLLVFGLGTVAGMALITTAIVLPSIYAAHRVTALRRYIQIGGGALSIGFGVLLAHEAGRGAGLFSAAPAWTPR